jgi:hypothetical protein
MPPTTLSGHGLHPGQIFDVNFPYPPIGTHMAIVTAVFDGVGDRVEVVYSETNPGPGSFYKVVRLDDRQVLTAEAVEFNGRLRTDSHFRDDTVVVVNVNLIPGPPIGEALYNPTLFRVWEIRDIAVKAGRVRYIGVPPPPVSAPPVVGSSP